MTDYAKHIETLGILQMLSYQDPEQEAALTAAIDLMRAAMPKDAEDEKALCFAAGFKTWSGRTAAENAEQIANLSAAARAEGYMQGVSACADALTAQAERLRNELSAAKAEIERLRVQVEGLYGGISRNEIFRRGKESADRELLTKLTNLRAAVEYVEELLGDGRDAIPPTAAKRMIRAAIEASR